MDAFRKPAGPRRRALLLGFLFFVFGLLPYLGATHDHEAGQGESSCQLCLAATQPFESAAPDPALPEAPALALLPAQDSRQALQSLYFHRESRGPPSV